MDNVEWIQDVLAGLAQFVGADRLYSLDLPATGADLVVERWQGV